MTRRHQLAKVLHAEASLVARRRTLHEHGSARLEALRRVPPALLLGGGALAGFVAHRLARRYLPDGSSLSSGLALGLRLLRLVPGDGLAVAPGENG